MMEYITVKLGDFWRFQPRSRKMFIFAIAIFGFVLYVPVPTIPNDIINTIFAVFLVVGFWCVFYGAYCFFAEQFKKRTDLG